MQKLRRFEREAVLAYSESVGKRFRRAREKDGVSEEEFLRALDGEIESRRRMRPWILTAYCVALIGAVALYVILTYRSGAQSLASAAAAIIIAGIFHFTLGRAILEAAFAGVRLKSLLAGSGKTLLDDVTEDAKDW